MFVVYKEIGHKMFLVHKQLFTECVFVSTLFSTREVLYLLQHEYNILRYGFLMSRYFGRRSVIYIIKNKFNTQFRAFNLPFRW